VPSTWQIGRLEIGSNKYAGTTTKYLENSNCVLVKMGTAATYNAPQQEWHFKRPGWRSGTALPARIRRGALGAFFEGTPSATLIAQSRSK
jgi:hypothetical protein